MGQNKQIQCTKLYKDKWLIKFDALQGCTNPTIYGLLVTENSMARLECLVVGIPQPKVLWLKNNRPLKNTDQCRVLSEGNVHVLEFPQTKKDDTGLYTARAMNVNGSTISSAELLVGNGRNSDAGIRWFEMILGPVLQNKECFTLNKSENFQQWMSYLFEKFICVLEGLIFRWLKSYHHMAFVPFTNLKYPSHIHVPLPFSL